MFFPRGLSRAVAGAALVLSLTSPAWAQAGGVLTLPEALARAESQAPALAAALPALKPGGWLYLEAAQAWGEGVSEETRVPPGLALRRHLKAGAVHAHLFERTDPA